jgi:hypothetical protein
MDQIATGFLSRCFAPGDTIALLLRNEREAKTQQRIVQLERGGGRRSRLLTSAGSRTRTTTAQTFMLLPIHCSPGVANAPKNALLPSVISISI